MVNFGYIKVERRTVSNRVATSAGNSSLLAPDSKGPPPKSCPPVESFLKSSAPPDSTERKFHSQLLAPDILSLSSRVFLSTLPTSQQPLWPRISFESASTGKSLSRFSRRGDNDFPTAPAAPPSNFPGVGEEGGAEFHLEIFIKVWKRGVSRERRNKDDARRSFHGALATNR